jgi:sRNA-binding carbon storage regulator CsrA
MLVIARGRNEAVVIDDTIRVEVLRLTGGVVRLRILAPKGVPVLRGVAKAGDPPAVEAVNGGVDATGLGAVELSLGPQHVITLGADIHLGLIDIAAGRAMLFVDGPADIAVKAEETGASRPKLAGKGAAQGQALLPFSNGSCGESAPSTIPFVRPDE